jgi:iron complex outermembrane receptor protein
MLSRFFVAPVVLCAGLSPVAVTAHSHPHEVLESIVVTGTPLSTNPVQTAQPVSVLSGQDLHRQVSASLGETVSAEPGVTSTYYGPVASRPVIRGLSGYRVQMLDDGLGSMDASSVSEDHSVAIEASLAERIEVLRGPAALLYGSGGAGGAINVVSARLPDARPQPAFGGTFEVRGDSALDERTAVAQVNGLLGNVLLHLDGFKRETGDVRIPGDRVSTRQRRALEAGAEIPEGHGRVPNSASDSWGSSAGVNYFGEAGDIGVSYTHLDSEYELPAEETALIAMKQDRFDVKGRWALGDGFFRTLKLRGGTGDYRHTEFEAPGEPGTRFENRAYELRVSADHEWGGGWRGTMGVQNAKQDFEALGDEAFVPASVTRTIGLFAFEEHDFGPWTLQAGARLDRQRVEVSQRSDYDGKAVNLALGAVWQVDPANALSFNLTRTERHPQATELYADGVHAALGRYEIGDEDLNKEVGYTLDVGVRHASERLTWSVGAFFNRYANYIFVAPTGTSDPDDAVPVFVYDQTGANLYGFEAQIEVPIAAVNQGDLLLRVMGDYLRGEVRGGGNLPFMPPYRFGAGIDYDRDALHLGLEVMRHAKQGHTASAELATSGYTMLSLAAHARDAVCLPAR